MSHRPGCSRSSSARVGQAAWCTDPSCHHDQTSSVTNGRNGANSLSMHGQRGRQRVVRRCGGLRALLAVAAALDELEVVVAEGPEERLGSLQHARVVVRLERRGRFVDQRRQGPEHGAVDRRVRRDRAPRAARPGRASANFEAFSSLIARRRPTRIWFGVERRVGARPAAGGPVAHAVRAVLLEQRHRRHHVALGLRHLLPIGIEHPAGDRRVLPRQRIVLQLRAQDGVEQPRADDVVRLRPQVHRETSARTAPDRRASRTQSAGSATTWPRCP